MKTTWPDLVGREEKEKDTMVQNMIVGMLGRWTEDGYSNLDFGDRGDR